MSFISRLKQRLGLNNTELPAISPAQNSPGEPKSVTNADYVSFFKSYYQSMFSYDNSRNAVLQEYDTMDGGWISAQLDVIVDACLISDDGDMDGFKVSADNNQYQAVINQVLRDTNLQVYAREILRNTLKYGDTFVAPIISSDGNIVGIEMPPIKEMIVNVDKHGRVLSGKDKKYNDFPAAYQQVTSALVPVAGWEPWEMYHLKFSPKPNTAYSRNSFLEPMRADWHKLRMEEEALVITRILRASPRQLHYVDVTGKTSTDALAYLEAYMKRIKDAKMSTDTTTGTRDAEKRTYGIDEDIFMPVQQIAQPNGTLTPTLGKVELIDPQLQSLRSLPDVEYLRDKIFARIPKEMVGIKTTGGSNDLSQQEIAAGRLFQWCQKILEIQLIRPMLALAIYMKFGSIGQDLDEVVKVQWPRVLVKTSWRLADALFRSSMAISNDINNNLIDSKTAAVARYGWTDAEWDRICVGRKWDMDNLPQPSKGDKASQTAQGSNSG